MSMSDPMEEIPEFNLTVNPCECGSRHFDVVDGRVECVFCGRVPQSVRETRVYKPQSIVLIQVMDEYGGIQIAHRIAVTGDTDTDN